MNVVVDVLAGGRQGLAVKQRSQVFQRVLAVEKREQFVAGLGHERTLLFTWYAVGIVSLYAQQFKRYIFLGRARLGDVGRLKGAVAVAAGAHKQAAAATDGPAGAFSMGAGVPRIITLHALQPGFEHGLNFARGFSPGVTPDAPESPARRRRG